MDQHQPQQMTAAEQDMARQAGAQESAAANEALAGYLQGRVVELRLEVMKRDERIAALEAELAAKGGSDADLEG